MSALLIIPVATSPLTAASAAARYSIEAIVAAYPDAELAIIRDVLGRSRETIAAHVESVLQQAGAGHARFTAELMAR